MVARVLKTLSALMVSAIILTVGLISDDAAAGGSAPSKTGQRTGTQLNTVEATTMSEPEAGNRREGRSEPAAGESAAGPVGKQPAHTSLPLSPAGWTVYADPIHGFQIKHPTDFVVKPQDIARLAHFAPTPLASILFMNPTMAAGALAGIEPADLEVRVYQAGTGDSLENWLISAKFASVESLAAAQPYRNGPISGLTVCQTTMIAPGCSTYVLRSGRVYQLTAISREGEAMIETFSF